MNRTSKELHDTRNRSKVGEYLDFVEARILRALSADAVKKSCSTTLLLVFATIDALGKLTDPDPNAGPGLRFRNFLSFMGSRYEERAKTLWELRNALVHNVINVESFLSSTDLEGWAHLERIGGMGLIYVNTDLVYRDLVQAFKRVKQLLETNDKAAQRASGRLKWVTDAQEAVGDEPLPTQPPSVVFVNAR